VAVASILWFVQPGGYGGFRVATPWKPKDRSGLACALPAPTAAMTPSTIIDTTATLRINFPSV